MKHICSIWCVEYQWVLTSKISIRVTTHKLFSAASSEMVTSFSHAWHCWGLAQTVQIILHNWIDNINNQSMITLEQGLKGNLCNCRKNILQVLLRITTGRPQILINIINIIYTNCIFIKAMINRNRNWILICFTLFLLVTLENSKTFK